MMRHVRKKHEFTSDPIQPKQDQKVYINYSTEQFTSLVEQNKKQAEMISFLLERNKQLQDKLNDQMIDL